MGWLLSYTLASITVSFIAVKIFDAVVADPYGTLVGIARAGLFILTWTAVTVLAGMQRVTKRVRQIRQGFIQRVLGKVKGGMS